MAAQGQEARFALVIMGENLPMEEVSALLGLTPTRTARKGDLLNKLPEIRAEQDEWICAIPLNEFMGRDETLNNILRDLAERPEELRKVAAMGRMTLRLHVQSDYAQMVYCLTPETLRRLAEIGMPLEVSSLSWGEVGM